MSEKQICQDVKDLSKTGVKHIESIEELVNRSIDNCSLNKYEGSEILKRLKKDKDALSEDTRSKLLDIAQKGGWNGIVRVLSNKNSKKDNDELKLKLSDTLTETKETKDAKNNLEYIIKSLESELNEVKDSKKWNTFSFWNKEDKKVKLEILNEVISILNNLKSNFLLSPKDIKEAISNGLSTSEGGTIYNKIRLEIKNILLLTYFSGDNFIPNLKQKSVDQIRKNLGSNELKDIFLMEFGQEYTKGMKVSEDKKWLLEEYENAFDAKNEWTSFSDENRNKAKGVAAYDIAPTIVTGGVAGIALKGIRGVKTVGTVANVAAKEDVAGTALKTAKEVASQAKQVAPKSDVVQTGVNQVASKAPTKTEGIQVPKVDKVSKPVESSPKIVPDVINGNNLITMFENVTPQVGRGLNKTIFLRNGAKGNVQMFFKRVAGKDQIDRVTVLINGETTSIKFVGDKAIQTVGKQDMTQSVAKLVDKYKGLLN